MLDTSNKVDDKYLQKNLIPTFVLVTTMLRKRKLLSNIVSDSDYFDSESTFLCKFASLTFVFSSAFCRSLVS